MDDVGAVHKTDEYIADEPEVEPEPETPTEPEENPEGEAQ